MPGGEKASGQAVLVIACASAVIAINTSPIERQCKIFGPFLRMVENTNSKTYVAIIGGIGSGAIVAQALRDIAGAGGELSPYGFLNDIEDSGTQIDGLPVLGRFEDWPEMPPETVFVAAIHKPKLSAERYARLASLGIPDNRWATVVHPAAHIAESATIGAGTYAGPNAVLRPGTQVGMHTSLRAGCYISHDVQIGDYGFVGPNAVVSGRVRVGKGAHIGPAAVCREDITIGNHAVIGIGSVVTRDVPDGAVVAGNPARVV